jgi:hypothetical protein
MTVGTPSQTDLSMMYVVHGAEPSNPSWQRMSGKSLLTTLKKCDFSLEDVIFITPDGPTKPITTVICYVRKKTPEKSGAT